MSRGQALAAYVGLRAAEVWVLAYVPGFPNYGEGREYLDGAVIVDLLLIYGLYRRSRLAWDASVVVTSLGLLMYLYVMLPADELQAKYDVVIVLAALQLALLFNRALRSTQPASERLGTAP